METRTRGKMILDPEDWLNIMSLLTNITLQRFQLSRDGEPVSLTMDEALSIERFRREYIS